MPRRGPDRGHVKCPGRQKMNRLTPHRYESLGGLVEGKPIWMHPIQWWRRQFYTIADENAGITLDREMKKRGCVGITVPKLV
jgi:hypothetical protein